MKFTQFHPGQVIEVAPYAVTEAEMVQTDAASPFNLKQDASSS